MRHGPKQTQAVSGSGARGPVGMFSSQSLGQAWAAGPRMELLPIPLSPLSLPHLSSPLATLQRAQRSARLLPDQGPSRPVPFKHTHVSFVQQGKKIHLLFSIDYNVYIIKNEAEIQGITYKWKDLACDIV